MQLVTELQFKAVSATTEANEAAATKAAQAAEATELKEQLEMSRVAEAEAQKCLQVALDDLATAKERASALPSAPAVVADEKAASEPEPEPELEPEPEPEPEWEP